MDGFHLWQEEYRREVDEVLAQLRAGKNPADAQSVVDIVIPPAGAYHELREAQERLARLTPLLQEARARLDARSEEIAAESHRREDLKDLALKLHLNLKAAAAELDAAHRRNAEDAQRADAAAQALEISRRERETLGAELEESARARAAEAEAQKRKAAQWASEAGRLEGKIDELQQLLRRRDEYLKALQQRSDESAHTQSVEVSAREERVKELTAEVERSRSMLTELSAQFAQRKAESDLSLRRVEEERAQLWEEGAGLKARLEDLLRDLKSERDARVADELARRDEVARFHAELELEERRRNEVETAFKDVAHELERQRGESEVQRKDLAAQAASLTLQAQNAGDEIGVLRAGMTAAQSKLAASRSETGAARQDADAAAHEVRRLSEALTAAEAAVKAAQAAAAEARKSAESATTAAERGRAEQLAGWEKEKTALQTAAVREAARLRQRAAEELKRVEDSVSSQLAAEKARLQAHWDAEAKQSAERMTKRTAQEAERARILAETAAAQAKAERALADIKEAPAPVAPEKKPAPAPAAEPKAPAAPPPAPGLFDRLGEIFGKKKDH